MEITLKVANKTLIKKNLRIYFGILFLVVGLLVWATVAAWFTKDDTTNKIIAYSIFGIIHFGFIIYNLRFSIKEKVIVVKDGIQTEQFNFIPYSDIVSYTP